MPDNTEPGALEDFLRYLVPDDDPVWQHAAQATADAVHMGAACGGPEQSKGTLHCRLAWQSPPGMPFGTALTAKLLRPDSAVARRFVDWLRALFIA